MKTGVPVFFVRWLLNSFGLWLSISLLSGGLAQVDSSAGFWGFILAGFIFSLINSILKPLIVFLSFPAILISLGLFMFIVNGLLVYISVALTPNISMSFWAAILTGIILSIVNYIVSAAVELRRHSGEE